MMNRFSFRDRPIKAMPFTLLCCLFFSSAQAITYEGVVTVLNKDNDKDISAGIVALKLSISWGEAKKLIQDFKANGNHLEGVKIPDSIRLSAGFVPPKKSSSLQRHLRISLSRQGQFQRKRGQWLPIAAQFSGAFQWDHKQGITGEKQTAIVFESNGDFAILRNQTKKTFSSALKINPLDIYAQGNADAHHIATTHTLHQIAPDATIARLPEEKDFPSAPEIDLATVVSHSSGFLVNLSPKKKIEKIYEEEKRIVKFLTSQRGHPKLFFQSPGNEQDSLSSPVIAHLGERVDTYEKYLLEDETLRPYLLIVGSVTPTFESTYNYPGQNKTIQNNFLCTLGKEVRVLSEKGHILENGTSLSTPIAAGAALLLMQKFPTLDIFQIKEVLLESAARSFVRNGDEFVCESKEEAEELTTFGPQKKTIPFDPTRYGKGILDLRAAFVYGELLTEDLKNVAQEKKPERATPPQLREKMKRILTQQNVAAATTLQRWIKPFLRESIKARKKEAPKQPEPLHEEEDELYA